MSIQLNQAIVIFFVWVFCLLEDQWFDKLLRYQIEGQAEKVGSPANKAIELYNKIKNRFLWIALATALTMILLSFHIDSATVRIAIISMGVLICLTYVILKLIPYNKSSKMLGKS